jgi:hypothetical protein
MGIVEIYFMNFLKKMFFYEKIVSDRRLNKRDKPD